MNVRKSLCGYAGEDIGARRTFRCQWLASRRRGRRSDLTFFVICFLNPWLKLIVIKIGR